MSQVWSLQARAEGDDNGAYNVGGQQGMTTHLATGTRPVLAVANAGGHMTQALCAMKAVPSFHLVTTVKIVAQTGAEKVHYTIGTQKNPVIFLINIFIAGWIIFRVRPVALFSTGGPACIPFAIVAKLIGLKFVYLDTLSRVVDLSNTAKFLYKHKLYSVMMSQWSGVADRYEGISYRGKVFDICNTGH